MSIDYTNADIFAYPKPEKKIKQKVKPINGQKHKQTKKTDIDAKTKVIVWERDSHRCIFCNKYVQWNYSCCHYIPRSAGGLGIEENVFTACEECHREQDNGFNSKHYTNIAREYLKSIYGEEWKEEKLIYKKY